MSGNVVNYGYQPYGPASGYSPYGTPSPVYDELVPGNSQNDYYGDPMLDLTILDIVEDVWCQVDYLNYNIKRPGDTLLGAPLANVPNPRDPFFVTLPNNFVGTARVGRQLGAIRQSQRPSARIGVPFRYFSIEAAAWGLEENSNYNEATDIPRFPQVSHRFNCVASGDDLSGTSSHYQVLRATFPTSVLQTTNDIGRVLNGLCNW